VAEINEFQTWTFDWIGTLVGSGGHEWHHVKWNDAGMLSSELAKGNIWVTAYSFLPIDDIGQPIGRPPIHIHHMHVTSSQDAFGFARGDVWGTPNQNCAVAVEFDVHGDRQCKKEDGGVGCISRFLPEGFGFKLVQKMQTFADVIDVRPGYSKPMRFSLLHSYRWTRVQQRQLARLDVGVNPQHPLPGYDTTELIFDPRSPVMAEYLMWQEFSFYPANLSVLESSWHTHHEFTYDQWLFIGRADTILPPKMRNLSTLVNLTALGMSIPQAMDTILIHANSHSVVASKRTGRLVEPRLMCRMAQDRWELAHDGPPTARLVLASCDRFDIMQHEHVTLVTFHTPLIPIDKTIHHFQHAAWYGIYGKTSETESIPHNIWWSMASNESTCW